MSGGIYVHVPFCQSFCLYCDFYSEIKPEGVERYGEVLIEEAASQKDFFKGVLPETLYFGGGTPSLLPPALFKRMVECLKSVFGVIEFDEFTVEVNPDDIVKDALCHQSLLIKTYKEVGVNRVSMGVQSFDDAHLKWMNRRHSASEAVQAFKLLRKAGFDNISIDLIFGFESLTMEDWQASIEKALELDPEHISCYQMSIEPGSALGELVEKGRYKEPDQEVCASQYALLQNMLFKAGFVQYEISNFAKPGRFSRHNSNYWARIPYLGLGPAAHSFDGSNNRYWNIDDISKWMENTTASRQGEALSDDDIFNEQIMLGLRRVNGVDLKSLDTDCLAKIKPALISQIKAGNICCKDDSFFIPAEKMFVSDGIMSELFL